MSRLTLGGGAGYLSRMWGLTSDNLRQVELVDGRGRMLTADVSTNPDLFWAPRGGGGSFGIVTALTFEVHAIGDVVAFTAEWPFAQAGAVPAAWQQHARPGRMR